MFFIGQGASYQRYIRINFGASSTSLDTGSQYIRQSYRYKATTPLHLIVCLTSLTNTISRRELIMYIDPVYEHISMQVSQDSPLYIRSYLVSSYDT